MSGKIFSSCVAALVIFVFAQASASEVLEKDLKVGNNTFPKGAEVGYYKSGKIAWVHTKRPLAVSGLRCIANSNVEFYESGKVKSIRLTSQTKIDGISCAANYLVELYENGKIRIAPLAESTVIQGIRVNGRDFVGFSEDGKLAMIMIHQPVEIKGKKYYPNMEIYLDENGNVKDTKKLADGVYYY